MMKMRFRVSVARLPKLALVHLTIVPKRQS
jgi:hypothetical protein